MERKMNHENHSQVITQNSNFFGLNFLDLPIEIVLLIASFCNLSRFNLAATCSSLLFIFDFVKFKKPAFVQNKRDWLLISEGKLDELRRNPLDNSLIKNNSIYYNLDFNNIDFVIYSLERLRNDVNYLFETMLINEHVNKFIVSQLRSAYDQNSGLIQKTIYILSRHMSDHPNIYHPAICDKLDDFKRARDKYTAKYLEKYGILKQVIYYTVIYRAENCYIYLTENYPEYFTETCDHIPYCMLHGTDKMCAALLKLDSSRWNKFVHVNHIRYYLYAAQRLPLERMKMFGYTWEDVKNSFDKSGYKKLAKYIPDFVIPKID